MCVFFKMRWEVKGLRVPKERTIFKMRMDERSVDVKKKKSVGMAVEMTV